MLWMVHLCIKHCSCSGHFAATHIKGEHYEQKTNRINDS